MSVESSKIELEKTKQKAIDEFLRLLEDQSNWELERPWANDFLKESGIIYANDNKSRYRIFISDSYLSVYLQTIEIIHERNTHLAPSLNFFSRIFKTAVPIKSELRQKIENLLIILYNEYKKNELKDALQNIIGE